ncbi:MAG: peptide-methionine (S)-S-oxide reductase MsrA [Acidobacteria bacterium]|nr:peptide-methionine (S)-S-oxide reductase MsrA [Acidobacteriota bacterium]
MRQTLAAAVLLLLFLNTSCGDPENAPPSTPQTGSGLAEAIFAGGCFWSMELAFEKVPGVVSATSGFCGGNEQNPTYEQVSSGFTGHVESVSVRYDPRVVTYEKLLDVYWHNIDPLTDHAQFCDHGEQYRTAIFTIGPDQARLAAASLRAVESHFGQRVYTRVTPASRFWPAEAEHQDFAKRNPVRYELYKMNCGRAERLGEVWK